MLTELKSSQEKNAGAIQLTKFEFLTLPEDFRDGEISERYLLMVQNFMKSHSVTSKIIRSMAEKENFKEINELANTLYIAANEIGALRLASISSDLALSTSLPKEVLEEALEIFDIEIKNVLKEIQHLV